MIKSGFNKPKSCHRTLLVALDLKSAFDTVSHGTLLHDIHNTDLPNNAKPWLLSYLRGRQTYTEHEGTKSKRWKVKQGVPQGGVISPFLFNPYMRSLPTPPKETSIVTYADDITPLTPGPKVENLAAKMNTYFADPYLWLETKSLILSAEKSTATIFSTWSNDARFNPNVIMNGKTIPVTKTPKILGATFDNMMTFGRHSKNISEKLKIQRPKKDCRLWLRVHQRDARSDIQSNRAQRTELCRSNLDNHTRQNQLEHTAN